MQPDVLVICDLENNVNEKGRYVGTPEVIEILSDSTRSKDMVDKLNTHMFSGVQEYWMLILNKRARLFTISSNDTSIAIKHLKKGRPFCQKLVRVLW